MQSSKIIIVIMVLGAVSSAFGQTEFIGQFSITKKPQITLDPSIKYYDSKITFQHNDAGIVNQMKIGELRPTGQSSKTDGLEYGWNDMTKYLETNCLFINGLERKIGNGISISLEFSKVNWVKNEQSKTPHTITPENRRLYTYNYVYGIEERLSIKQANKIILDTLIGKITDLKYFTYSEKKEHINGGYKIITALDYENKQVFAKVRSILADKFETRDVTVGIEAEEFKDKDPLELNVETKKLIRLLNNKNYNQIDKVEIENIINVYESFLSQASENKKDKINPKVSRKLQYNTAIACFLIGNFNKAKELLSLDEKNTKSQSSLFSGFSSKFDFIKNQFANDGSLASTIQSANNKYYVIESGFDLMNFIKSYGNVLGRKQ